MRCMSTLVCTVLSRRYSYHSSRFSEENAGTAHDADTQMTRLRLRARPTLDDVDRLARGLRAKRRGTGSRAVAHRLNRDEMRVFERAKRDGFAAVRSARDRRGTGSPLLNTLRQRADALAQPLVWAEFLPNGESGTWACCVDFSPLRCASEGERKRWVRLCHDTVVEAGGTGIPPVGAVLEMPSVADITSLPIWQLPWDVAAFEPRPPPPPVDGAKWCKSTAARLADVLRSPAT